MLAGTRWEGTGHPVIIPGSMGDFSYVLRPLPGAAKALYSVPGNLIGCRVDVRADRALVRVFHRGQLVKVHPRMPAGGRSTDPADLPAEKTVYAMANAGEVPAFRVRGQWRIKRSVLTRLRMDITPAATP